MGSWRNVAVNINLFYASILFCQNGCAINSRSLVIFRCFNHKWSFAVCATAPVAAIISSTSYESNLFCFILVLI